MGNHLRPRLSALPGRLIGPPGYLCPPRISRVVIFLAVEALHLLQTTSQGSCDRAYFPHMSVILTFLSCGNS